MTINHTQPHDNKDVPGGFSAYLNSKPDKSVTLTARQSSATLNLPVSLTFTLGNAHLDALPDYPADLPEATVAMDFEHGPQTYVTVGDRNLIFWSETDIYGQPEVRNSFTDGQDHALDDLDEDTASALIAWGSAVQDRVRKQVESVTEQAVDEKQIQAAIVASATGSRYVGVDYDATVSAPARAVARAAKQVGAWTGTVVEAGADNAEPNAEHVADILSDLRHFCDANSIDFDEALNSGTFVYRDEIRNPLF
jgi:hypothetical protein